MLRRVAQKSAQQVRFVTKDYSAKRIQTFGESIWSEFQQLAAKYKVVNLGQGFPDWDPEQFTLQALANTASKPVHQYARAHGDLQLVNSIAKMYSGDKYNGFDREIEPLTEVMVVNGASDGLTVCLNAFINPGDEVVCIEPFFDCYDKMVESVGATPLYVPLRPPKNAHDSTAQEWTLDEKELRASITKKTRALILNTPHNPTGKIFSRAELEMVARVAKDHDLLIISDEVYEFLVFDEKLKHERIANIPGMWDRTVTIMSSGKTFSTTGWKMGWLIGPKHLIDPTYKYNMFKIFSVATPIQKAVSECIEYSMQNDYFSVIQNRLKERQTQLLETLDKTGLDYVKCSAGYFVLADASKIDFPYDPKSDVPRDHQLCRWLPEHVGLMAIPPSVFYSPQHKRLAENYIRLAFCKKKETLDNAKPGFEKLATFIK